MCCALGRIVMNSVDTEHFSIPLLDWYDRNKRDMVWRDRMNPYYTWISEIMLQQTRIEAATGYFIRFIEELPDIQSLAKVPEERLMKLWEGLGYYNRARNLKKAAEKIVIDYEGQMPGEYEELIKLPGIGSYTAGALSLHDALPICDRFHRFSSCGSGGRRKRFADIGETPHG